MLRVSAVLLAAILAFGLVFSLLPAGAELGRSGVTLQHVRLSLYPAQDPKAVWRFEAGQVRVNPELDENTLDRLGQGQRVVQDPDGTERTDLTLSASQLIIDKDSNLRTSQARLYVVADCISLDMRSVGSKQVMINQQGGFFGPYVKVDSPSLRLEYDDMSANFDLSNTSGSQREGGEVYSTPTAECLNGKAIPRKAP
ncbi:hypothetical protein [Deinococcus sonorensis]|uniref:LPS export ABC transporter periplasmic protein LptC n=2 Tax=Deinococcus sonorensis TaxID=309891 RepID=A0AAU7UDK5_9DEIO